MAITPRGIFLRVGGLWVGYLIGILLMFFVLGVSSLISKVLGLGGSERLTLVLVTGTATAVGTIVVLIRLRPR